jgi:hypothetical protein
MFEFLRCLLDAVFERFLSTVARMPPSDANPHRQCASIVPRQEPGFPCVIVSSRGALVAREGVSVQRLRADLRGGKVPDPPVCLGPRTTVEQKVSDLSSSEPYLSRDTRRDACEDDQVDRAQPITVSGFTRIRALCQSVRRLRRGSEEARQSITRPRGRRMRSCRPRLLRAPGA